LFVGAAVLAIGPAALIARALQLGKTVCPQALACAAAARP
jgi:hypothetical protein